MRASFPRTRRQRVDWLKRNRGYSLIIGFEYKTDREVKRIFELEYQGEGRYDKTIINVEEIADELSL